MPIIKQCKICGADFKTKPFFVKRGEGKYCSAGCHHKGTRKGKNMKCFICKKETYKSLKAINGSKSKKYFCGRGCQTKWRNVEFSGSKHANWQEGKYAYRSVLNRHKVPKICRLCKMEDIRVLAVHHVDKDRTNNDIKNLVWLCNNCHFLVHHYDEERKKFMEALV